MTPEKRIELAKRVLETLERGLEAITVKGPRSLRVPDNMARMRAVELGVEILGLRASRRQSSGPAAVVIALADASSKVSRNLESKRVTESRAVGNAPPER
jgi:hypothetical protein